MPGGTSEAPTPLRGQACSTNEVVRWRDPASANDSAIESELDSESATVLALSQVGPGYGRQQFERNRPSESASASLPTTRKTRRRRPRPGRRPAPCCVPRAGGFQVSVRGPGHRGQGVIGVQVSKLTFSRAWARWDADSERF